MLSSSRLLVCFDPLTNIIYESVLNGTPVYAPDAGGFLDYQAYSVTREGDFIDPKLISLAIINHSISSSNLHSK